MWKNRYKNVYKTRNPNLIITAVRSFPNINDTLEKNIEYYKVKKLQKEPLLLDIYADYYRRNGNDFIPLYFMDDVPKLKKLQILQPLDKGWFWCIGYKQVSAPGEKYISRTYDWYKERLKYMIENHYQENNGIIHYLFLEAIKYWIYDNSPETTEKFNHRRFDLIENKSLTIDVYKLKKRQFLTYLDGMEYSNWYKFVFHAFK